MVETYIRVLCMQASVCARAWGVCMYNICSNV